MEVVGGECSVVGGGWGCSNEIRRGLWERFAVVIGGENCGGRRRRVGGGWLCAER